MRPQRWLAEAAGLHRNTVDLLENGRRRPSTVTVWKLARALRPAGTLRDKVAVDQRLREAAGESLVHSATRPHVARERVRAELLAEAGGLGPVAAEGDNLGLLILAELDRAAHGNQHGAG